MVQGQPEIQAALIRLFGQASGQVTPMQGDASSRRYFRYETADGESYVIMLMPPDERSEEGPIDDAVEVMPERPFVNLQRFLSSRGVRVPHIYPQDASDRVLVLEDLGDTTLFTALSQGASKAELYPQIVDLLAKMHQNCEQIGVDCIASTRSFDQGLLRWELEHFLEWGHDALVGKSPAVCATLNPVFDRICSRIAELPIGFVHRDFQSKNLLALDDGSWGIIDFQDALRGPRAYDLVALLCDSYVDLDTEFQRAMLGRYASQRNLPVQSIEAEFWLIAAQRKLKDAGRFIYLDRVKSNPDFLRWFPQSLVYAHRALERIEEGPAVNAVLSERIPGYPNEVPIPQSAPAASAD